MMKAGAHAKTQSAYSTPQRVHTPGIKTPPLTQAAKPTAHTASHAASSAGPAAVTGMSSKMGRIMLASQEVGLVKLTAKRSRGEGEWTNLEPTVRAIRT
jgi:hypothetical protein